MPGTLPFCAFALSTLFLELYPPRFAHKLLLTSFKTLSKSHLLNEVLHSTPFEMETPAPTTGVVEFLFLFSHSIYSVQFSHSVMSDSL